MDQDPRLTTAEWSTISDVYQNLTELRLLPAGLGHMDANAREQLLDDPQKSIEFINAGRVESIYHMSALFQ
jgi:hypothetical protein